MTRLFGHDEAIAAFRDAVAGDRVHHAWLLAGPQGVGKASFALAAARRLLADAAGPRVDAPGLDVPDEHPTARLLAAGSHPDFRLVEREVWRNEKELKPRDERGGGDPVARSIRILQIRWLDQMLALAPAMSGRRVIVIDAVDDLERGAANALLKRLEEPPEGTLFLLVSHAPGRLLPTIRSRCRTLRFPTLPPEAMRAAVAQALPDAEPREVAALAAAGEGAPGRALRFAGLDMAALDEAIETLIARGDPTNALRSALAKRLAGKAAQARYEAFLERVPARVAAHARGSSGESLAQAIARWEQARSLAESAVRLSLDPQAVAFELGGLLAALAPRPSLANA